MAWRDRIPRCFGKDGSLEFARRPHDVTVARELLERARLADAPDSAFIDAARQFLVSHDVSEQHMRRQMKRVREFVSSNPRPELGASTEAAPADEGP